MAVCIECVCQLVGLPRAFYPSQPNNTPHTDDLKMEHNKVLQC